VDTTRVHNIEISRGTSKTLVETRPDAQLEENLCLELADVVPEVLLHGPNICIVCGCDPCEFQQMEMEILVWDRNHNEDVGLDAGERKQHQKTVGHGVRKKLPSCIEDGVRSLFPAVDGKVMVFLDE
jgi:hypothetical protein